jgi:ABC-type transporter Mla MlaB component
MTPKEPNPGLLSKMAKFVRNPTKDWAEPDTSETGRDGGYSKAALKEVIERKRQNDLVRRREFDVLRKLRRNEPVPSSGLGNPPSFFQSSLNANHGERALTIKKIDDIEAQMSKQWWKGKPDVPPAAAKRGVGGDQGNVVTVPPSRAPTTFAPTQVADNVPPPLVSPHTDFEPTRTGGHDLLEKYPPKANKVKPASVERNDSVFSSFDLFSVELNDDLANPDLEEAAIRFANGDDAGAEATLLGALRADNVQASMADVWATALFDLYRATGQELSFDRVAIEYAQRYGRSAPAWFSLPELLGRVTPTSSVKPTVTTGHQFSWDCPTDLDAGLVAELRTELVTAAMPWQLNWTHFAGATDDAASDLADLFSAWGDRPVKLQFTGVESLQAVLQEKTPTGDAQVALCWWQLRLNLMRLLAQQDEFELAALDYCVTYEVSPPPWRTPQCKHVFERVSLSETGADSMLPLASGSLGWSAIGSPVSVLSNELDALPGAELELTGEIIGDATGALEGYDAGAEKGCLVVSCARLIRVDFSAAGSLLNWVAERVAEGCEVRFTEVPRLVAAFFNVIGISEHAQVVLRNR